MKLIQEIRSYLVENLCKETKKWWLPERTRHVSSMIHSARLTVSPVVTLNIEFCFDLLDFEKWEMHARTDNMCKNNELCAGQVDQFTTKEVTGLVLRNLLYLLSWIAILLCESVWPQLVSQLFFCLGLQSVSHKSFSKIKRSAMTF